MEGNTIIARVSTLAPAGVPLEDLVRTLVDDLQQAIDTTHYLFALAIRDGVCTPELIEDTNWVEHSLAMATAGRRNSENGQQADPPPPDDDNQEEYEEETEKEIEIRADDEDQYEEDEGEDGSPIEEEEEEEEEEDSPRPHSSGNPRPPWE